MANEEDSLLDKIEKKLFRLRDPKDDDSRYSVCYDLLEYLNYTKDLSMFKYDAFLIKAVNKVFGEFTPDADIVLMALGLLDGYNYRIILKHTDRRIKFLKESPYLGSKKDSYDEVDKGRRESYEKTIRERSENPKLHSLAKYLEGIQDQVEEFLDDIDNYIDGKTAILPTPSYISKKPPRKRAMTAVIKYIFSGEEKFSTSQDIVINKNNECEITIELAKGIATRSSAKPFMLFCVLVLCVSVLTTVLSLEHTSNKVQETGMEYQAEESIRKNIENNNFKWDISSNTIDTSTKNGKSSPPFD